MPSRLHVPFYQQLEISSSPSPAKLSIRLFRHLAIIGVAIAIVTGCSGEEEAKLNAIPAVEATIQTVDTPTSSVAASPTYVQQQSRSGGRMRYSMRGNLVILDPAVGFTPASRDLYSEIYSGLMKLTENPGRPFTPELAERYTEHDGGMMYEFTLRQGLKFSDGSPLTASDFKWSWERALRPEVGSDDALSVLAAISGARGRRWNLKRAFRL